MCIGHTLGEEILFGHGAGENNTIRRSESAHANAHSCVLQLNVKDFNKNTPLIVSCAWVVNVTAANKIANSLFTVSLLVC